MKKLSKYDQEMPQSHTVNQTTLGYVTRTIWTNFLSKESKGAKIRNQYNQEPHPEYQWESDKLTVRHHKW